MLPFWGKACANPPVILNFHDHASFALKIAHRNTLSSLEKFKLLIMYSMLILMKKYNFGQRLFKANFGIMGIKIILPHRGLSEERGSIIFIPKNPKVDFRQKFPKLIPFKTYQVYIISSLRSNNYFLTYMIYIVSYI